MGGHVAKFAALLVIFVVSLEASWGRSLLSLTGDQYQTSTPQAPPPEIYTLTARLRDLHLTSPLIPSALPESQRRISSDEWLRPQPEWGTPQREQRPLDVTIFIGIFTGAITPGGVLNSTHNHTTYNYTARREMIRASWMPVARRYRHVAVKFVVGTYSDPAKQASIEEEHRRHGDFMTLTEVDDTYSNLGNKTKYFFRDVYLTYPRVEYIVKLDDDVLLLPDRLLMVADQWSVIKADYIGCANKARPRTNPIYRSYNPLARLVGKKYALYFVGSAYVLSGRIVRDVIVHNFDELRTSLEDIEMSWWMLASDAVHFEDRRLCRLACDEATVALMDQDIQGFPTMYWSRVFSNEGCTRTPKFPLPYVPVQFRRFPGLLKMHELMV